MKVTGESIEPREALRFFRQKVPLPTKRWTDIWEGAHARAFVIAGAQRDEVLSDFRGALDKAIAEGTTLETFRKDFDKIVKEHGWSHNGNRGWRSRVIYRSNLRTARAAGQWERIKRTHKTHPYLAYELGPSRRHRPEHVEWAGTILPATDPWWSTHYPPNGWGCNCRVRQISSAEMRRNDLTPDESPRIEHREWTDPATGEILDVPKGIDPGWANSAGESAWGRIVSEKTMNEWQASKDKWERLTPGSWKVEGRPERLTASKAKVGLSPTAATKAEMVENLQGLIGGSEKVFPLKVGEFTHRIHLNADVVGGHIALNRSRYLPLLVEALETPQEVWLSFERHTATGEIALRYRMVKAFNLGNNRTVLAVANARKGRMEGWTFVPTGDVKYVNKQREGQLLWAEK